MCTNIASQKKPKHQELRSCDKRRNRSLARVRVRAEHAIAGVKICRITKDVFRNLADGLSDLAMWVATGLHNFRRARRHYRHKCSNAYFE
jgi:hypothetical protein